MLNFRFLHMVLPCALALAACSDSPSDAPSDGDSADQDDGDSDDDSSAGGKMDGGIKPNDAGSKNDGGGKSDGGAKNDAGRTADAGPVGLDAGAKPDAGPSKSDAGGEPSKLLPKCVKKDSQVMVIGDSYINWPTHTFPSDIVTASKQNWRMLAIGGWSMGSGGLGLIPTQFDNSIALDPDAHTVLMDGGGNDVLLADPTIDAGGTCKTDDAPKLKQCQTIVDKAIAAADQLLLRASKAGIRDVVYFFYPHVPKGTLLGGPNPVAMLDFASPQIKTFCDGVEAKTSGATRCTFIDMVPVFEGHPDWYSPGDIHENSMGSKAMADKVWKVMSDKCIAQKSGDCCED